MNLVTQPQTPILTADRGDMCYCPGCSHAAVLESLGAAMERLQLKPHEVCIVSDIGCIGTADRYFACHTFHGLHGRSITYAEGIRRVRPDMTVIVLIGDGGCGIGTAHLVHAARRGIGIKVIVCNNFNFGMTGGQHSPTTPPESHTTTTPSGAIERPFDICATVMANGAAHVGRFSALDTALVSRLEAALRSPGFALLDIWELCTAYFVPANKLKPTSFAPLAEKYGLPFGLLRDDSPPQTVSSAAPPRSAQSPGRPADENPRLAWPGRREITIAGSAGQRIRSAGGVIGEIAVRGGLFAAQLDDFPITVRKGHSVSQLIVSDRPIRYSGVDRPDLIILLSEDGLRRLGDLSCLGEEALVIADQELPLPALQARVQRIDLRRIEKDAGKMSAALAALTMGILIREWLDGDAIERAVQARGGRYNEGNLAAVRHGRRMFQESLKESMPAATCQEVGP